MPSWTTRIVFVIQLHVQRESKSPWYRTASLYSPSVRLLTVIELGGAVALNSPFVSPTELVPTKNSTCPELVPARSSARKANVAGAAKIAPSGGQRILRTGRGGPPTDRYSL